MSDSSPLSLEEDCSKDVAFHVDENAYETVEFVSRNAKRDIVIKNNANKKCLIVMSVLLVIAILLGLAVVIAFPIQNGKLSSSIHKEIDSLDQKNKFFKRAVHQNIEGTTKLFNI